jgi:hypothetical protein
MPTPTSPTPTAPTPSRRLRDRLLECDTDSGRLAGQHLLTNHLLLFDDDVRETAAALGDIESYLARALRVVAREDLTRHDLERLAADLEVEAKIAALDDTLASLRHRLQVIAANLE